MENDLKRILSSFSLIFICALIFLTSFFNFSFKEFDWPFFILSICYLFFSTIIGIFAAKIIASGNKMVLASRTSLNKSLRKIDEGNKWDDYKKEFVQSHTVTNFYDAYVLYYFKNEDCAYRRKNAKLSEHDFKSKFLNKDLINELNGEKISIIKKIKIKQLVHDQDDCSHIDKTIIRYKKGDYLGKFSSQLIIELFSILMSLGSFVLSLLIGIRFDILSVLNIKLFLFVFLFIGDFYFIYKTTNAYIDYEVGMAKAYEDICEILINGKESDNKKRFAYHVFKEIE